MFAVAGLASTVPDALHGGQNTFVVAYVCVRAILLVLYARVYRDVEVARPVAGWFMVMFGLGVMGWLVSLAVPVPWKYAVWGVALAVEYAAPIRAWRLLRGVPVDPRHLPERFGLLIIIVLGEGVIGVVLGTAEVSWTLRSGAVAFAGFLTGAAIWWLYFDFLDATSVVTRNVRSGLTFVYAHFFVAAGIAALGVGVKLAILSVEPGAALRRHRLDRRDGNGALHAGTCGDPARHAARPRRRRRRAAARHGRGGSDARRALRAPLTCASSSRSWRSRSSRRSWSSSRVTSGT